MRELDFELHWCEDCVQVFRRGIYGYCDAHAVASACRLYGEMLAWQLAKELGL